MLDNVIFDNGAERMTSFSAFYVDEKRDQVRRHAVDKLAGRYLATCTDR